MKRRDFKIPYCCLLMCICAFACCKPSLKPAEYARFVTDSVNGLKKAVEVNGFEYRIQYRPHDYIVLMETKAQADGQKINERLSELKGTAWFTISIKRADNAVTPLRYNVTSIDEYDNRLNYFLNEAKNDIWLLYGTDTLRPKSYLFENNYNLTPFETMVVGFYLPGGEAIATKEMQVSYNDKVFKNGIIRAAYTERSLKNIPNIKLN